jgi:hypothetical protein
MLKGNKNCTKCNQIKPLIAFSKHGAGGIRSACKVCINNDWSYRLMSNISSRTKRRIRQNGDDRKIIFTDHNITKQFLQTLKDEQQGLCYWLKIPIDFTMKDTLRKPSLDRLDNTKGYEIGNVVLTTLFANMGRRDATINEMKSFITNYFK